MTKKRFISFITVLSLILSFIVLPANAVSPYSVVLPDPDLGGGTPEYNGTYYIKNVELAHFMQMDDGASPSDSGAHMELQDFSGGDAQKWIFTCVGDEYYKITSVAGGLALTAPTGETSSDEEPLYQTPYTGLDSQKWTFEETSRGTYVIRPYLQQTTDWCMAAGVGWIISNGRNVERRAYINNDEYNDEWELIKFIDSSFVSIPDENHDHDGSFPSILTSLSQMSFSTNRTSYSLDKYTCAAYISSSEIFYSRSHGSKSSIQLNDDNMTISTLNSLDNTAFSNCRLVLYGACSTGSGGSGSDNLVNETYDKGAQTVIGFQIAVYCNEVNMWATAFFDALSSGATVENACHAADTYVQNNWNYTISTNSWYIAGSRTQTF